jgi:hypothetical protein
MSDAARAALERLLADLCADGESAAFLARWGEAVPSERATRRLHVAAPADPAFAWLEVRPWDGGAIGGVEVGFAAGEGPSVGELEAWFGPLHELPAAPDGDPLLSGEWRRDDLPVGATLLVPPPDAPDAPVDELTLRRGR